MPDQNKPREDLAQPRAERIAISSFAASQPASSAVSVQVAPADKVLVEPSDTLKRIHRPGLGDYLVCQTVLVVAPDGTKVEITTDASPEEIAQHG